MTALAFLLLTQQMPDAEDPRSMFVSGPRDAFYMEPAEVVSKPFARRLQWLGDGSTLLVERLVPPANTPPLLVAEARQSDGLTGLMKLKPRIQLVAWSRRSRVSRNLLDLDPARVQIEEIEPFAKSDQALVSLYEHPLRPDGTEGAPVFTRALLSASTGTLRRLWSADQPVAVELSPSRPLGALVVGPRQGVRKIIFFGADGKLGNPIPLANKASLGFSNTGQPGVGTIELNPKGKRVYVFRLMNVTTGALGAEATPGEFDDVPIPLLSIVDAEERQRKTTDIKVRVEQGRDKPARGEDDGLVTNDGYLPTISPANDAVAYLSGHSAFVRPLVRIDRREFAAAMLEAAKQKAMRDAKQVGTAMSMYAMDFDDAFPPSAGEGKDVVNPYLKNRSLLDGFTYTFGGGPISGKPGDTELGYMGAPGGRVVIYGDGSVKYLPDP